MNFSSIFGILLAFSVLIGTMLTSAKDSRVFLDPHAFMIVIGGTFAASLLSFSGKKMYALMRIFFKRVLGKSNELSIVINEVVDLAKGYRENEGYLKEKQATIKTFFLKEAVELFTEGGIDPAEMDRILLKRSISIHHRYEEDAENFKALSKFPPAFGLLGAVIGMVSLMQNLGGADAMQKVGPSMAVALVATLYGIAVANFFFLPLGEKLTGLNKEDQLVRSIVLDGIKLIRNKKHPLIVEESIKSYLLPAERAQIKRIAA
ncbi:MAG: MotA/TolQ/ExbB proton channel family protein [Bdellovibrionaceae bacterium]|nr:MotA/TolQ/ExbB proton channel family protein [Bdellovibrio sp.]